ncbi:hypothetical protein HDU98_003521, partial [Podochytrium sp. JEL0797]
MSSSPHEAARAAEFSWNFCAATSDGAAKAPLRFAFAETKRAASSATSPAGHKATKAAQKAALFGAPFDSLTKKALAAVLAEAPPSAAKKDLQLSDKSKHDNQYPENIDHLLDEDDDESKPPSKSTPAVSRDNPAPTDSAASPTKPKMVEIRNITNANSKTALSEMMQRMGDQCNMKFNNKKQCWEEAEDFPSPLTGPRPLHTSHSLADESEEEKEENNRYGSVKRFHDAKLFWEDQAGPASNSRAKESKAPRPLLSLIPAKSNDDDFLNDLEEDVGSHAFVDGGFGAVGIAADAAGAVDSRPFGDRNLSILAESDTSIHPISQHEEASEFDFGGSVIDRRSHRSILAPDSEKRDHRDLQQQQQQSRSSFGNHREEERGCFEFSANGVVDRHSGPVAEVGHWNLTQNDRLEPLMNHRREESTSEFDFGESRLIRRSDTVESDSVFASESHRLNRAETKPALEVDASRDLFWLSHKRDARSKSSISLLPVGGGVEDCENRDPNDQVYEGPSGLSFLADIDNAMNSLAQITTPQPLFPTRQPSPPLSLSTHSKQHATNPHLLDLLHAKCPPSTTSSSSPLATLLELSLDDAGITSLNTLATYTPNVIRLSVSGNEIVYLDGVPGCLTTLIAKQNRLSNLTSFTRLRNLKYADLSGNDLTDLNALKMLHNLKELNVSGNSISELMLDHHDFPCLQSLDASRNQIAVVVIREGSVPLLQSLYVDQNKIHHLHIHSPTLRKLHAEHNCLDPVEHGLESLALGACGALESLNLGYNRLFVPSGSGGGVAVGVLERMFSMGVKE